MFFFYKWILDLLWKPWALNYHNDSQWRFQGFSCNSFLLKSVVWKTCQTTCINNHKNFMLQNHVHTKNKGRVEHIHVTRGHWHPFMLILSICMQAIQSSIGFTKLHSKAPRVAMVHLLAALRWGRKGFEAPEFEGAPGSWISLWQHLRVHRYSIESAELLEDTTPALPCASQRDSSDVVFERFQW